MWCCQRGQGVVVMRTSARSYSVKKHDKRAPLHACSAVQPQLPTELRMNVDLHVQSLFFLGRFQREEETTTAGTAHRQRTHNVIWLQAAGIQCHCSLDRPILLVARIKTSSHGGELADQKER
jgi:hypothetical protein